MSPILFFDNKKFISVKDASTLTGYAKDYVGQLCRGGKIESRRIGRLWYVSEESILGHLNSPASYDFSKNLHLAETKDPNISSSVSATAAVLDGENIKEKGEFLSVSENTEEIIPKVKTVKTDSFKKSSDTLKNDVLRKISAQKEIFVKNIPGVLKGVKSGSKFLSNKLLPVAIVLIFALGTVSVANGISGLYGTIDYVVSRVPSSLAKIETEISALPQTAYQSLSDISDSYAQKISGVYFSVSETISGKNNNSIAFQKDPSVLIENMAEWLAVSERKIIDNSFSELDRKISQIHYKTFSFLSDAIGGASDAKIAVGDSASKFTASVSFAVKKLNPVDSAGVFVYDSVNEFFFKKLYSPVLAFLGKKPQVAQFDKKVSAPSAKPIKQVAVIENKGPIITRQIIERVTERVVETSSTGNFINRSEFESRLSDLNNKIAASFSAQSTGSGGNITNIYNEIAGTQKIDQLNGTVITSASINQPSVSGGTLRGTTVVDSPSVSGSSLSFENGLFSNFLGISTTSPYRTLSVSGSGVFTGGDVLASTFTATSSITTPQLCISGDCKTSWPTGGGTGGGTWSTTTSQVAGQLVNYSANSTDIVTVGGSSTTTAKYWFDPNSQTSSITGSTLFPSLSQGFSYIGSNGLLNTIASSSIKLSWFNNDSGFTNYAFPFTSNTNYQSTTTTLGLLNGFFSTASSTISGSLSLPSLTNGQLSVYSGVVGSYATTTAGTGLTYSGNAFNLNTTQNITNLSNLSSNGLVYTAGSNGTLNTTGTSTPTISSTLSYSGTAGYFVGGSSGTLSLNLSNPNTWTALQTLTYASTTQLTLNGQLYDSNNSPGTGGYILMSRGSGLAPQWVASTTLSTISGTLAIANGGTNATTYANNTLIAYDGTRFVSTSTPTFGAFNATSTTATSTISTGGFTVGTSQFVVQQNSGNVGIGNANPNYKVDINGQIRVAGDYLQSGGNQIRNLDNALYLTTDTANPIIFRTSGAEKVRIDSNGNVGIGTTSPGAKLVVSSSGTGGQIGMNIDGDRGVLNSQSGYITFTNKNTNLAQINGYTGASGSINYGQLVFSTANSGTLNERMRIDETGSLGLSSTTPGYRLSVAGSGFFDGGTVTASQFIATSSITVPSLTVSGLALNSLISTNASGILTATSTPTFGSFNATSTTATSTISTGGFTVGTSQFVVQQNSGNVGVGTTDPQGKLDIAGSLGNARISSEGAALQFTRSGVNYIRALTAGGSLSFNVNGNATANGSMVIKSDGNVGIGTTTPQYLLTPYSATAPQLSLSAGGGLSQWTMRNAGGNLYISTTTVAGTATTSTSALTILNNGNVGVGTTAPGGLLQLGTGNTATVSSKLSIFDTTGSVYTTYKNNYNELLLGVEGVTGTFIGNYGSAYPFSIRTNNTARLVIDGSGNVNVNSGQLYVQQSTGYVGIGSTTPTALLSLQPTASIQDIFRVSTSTPGFGGPALAVSWYGGLTQNISSTTALNIQDGKSNSIFTVDTTQSSTNAGIDITAGASQTGNLLNLYSSGGTYLSGFTASGGLLMNLSSTTAIDVWNGSASPIFRVDTVNKWLYLATSTSPTFTADGQIAIGNADTTASGGRIWIRSGATTFRFTSSANTADYSEFFYTPATSSAKSVGTIMSVDTGTTSPVVGTGAVIPSTVPYDENLIGAVSMNGTSYNNPEDTRQTNNNFANVGMLGHIPVLISDFSEPIHVGDYITSSGENGKGMKATKSGMVLGSALEDYTPASSTSRMILVLVNPGYKVIGTANDIFATTTIAEILGPNSTSSPQTWSSAFADASETLRNAISSLGDVVVRVSNDVQYAAVGIYNKIFAKEVHTDKLCVEDVCVTKQEFVKMVQMANTSSATGGSTSVTTSSTGPTITLFGNNPAEISVGVVYSDLGVSAKDSSGNELGYTVSVDGATSTEPSLMNIDTSISGSHQIIYRAVDGAGNSASATRVVNVVDITTNSSGSTTDTTSSSTPSTDSTDVATSSPSN